MSRRSFGVSSAALLLLILCACGDDDNNVIAAPATATAALPTSSVTSTAGATRTATAGATGTATAGATGTATGAATRTATAAASATVTPAASVTVTATPASVMHMVTVGPNGNTIFDPASLTIAVGDTVQWTWGSSGHSVTSGSNCAADGKFCSPNDTNCAAGTTSGQNATYTHTFTAAGTYPYFCTPHCGFGMVGTITVTGPGTAQH